MIGLADCNNFFVSCERTINKDLEGRAVVVMSNNDGCAIARSNEAKALGIKMGQPMFEIRHLVNSGQLVALSSNYALYHEISNVVHKIFHKYAPTVIDYSVDEAFSTSPVYLLKPLTRLVQISATNVYQKSAYLSLSVFRTPRLLLRLRLKLAKRANVGL